MNKKSQKPVTLLVAALAVAILFLIGICVQASKAPSPTPEEIELSELQELERNIVIQAEEGTLHYSEQKKWARDEFTRLIEEEQKFGSHQIEKFRATYAVDAGNFHVDVNEEEKTTTLECDIYVELDTWYDFHWFLGPLGLDFIDDHFERSERELSWEGRIDGVEASILLKFPFKIANCHAHVWPAE